MLMLRWAVLCCALLMPISVWAGSAIVEEAGGGIPRFLTSALVTSDTAVLSRAGFLQCIMVSMNDAAPTAGSIIIYDNTAESGTVIFSHTFTTAVFMPFQICPQREITTGIYVGFTTTADVNVSVSYK